MYIKIFSFLLVVVFSIHSQFNCLDSSSAQLLNQITKTYKKQQMDYNKFNENSRYYYEIMNIELFPFFFINFMNDKKIQRTYLCDHLGSFNSMIDVSKNKHIQIAIMNYTKQNNTIRTKTYQCFFYCKHSNEWVEERKPIKIVATRKVDDSYDLQQLF